MVSFRKRILISLLLLFTSILSFSQDNTTIFHEDSLRYLRDNGIITMGFGKRIGETISYFERKSQGENLINNHDAGSFYQQKLKVYHSQTKRSYLNT